jgi:hypothetical protein
MVPCQCDRVVASSTAWLVAASPPRLDCSNSPPCCGRSGATPNDHQKADANGQIPAYEWARNGGSETAAACEQAERGLPLQLLSGQS